MKRVKNTLLGLRRNELQTLALENDVPTSGTKDQIALRLLRVPKQIGGTNFDELSEEELQRIMINLPYNDLIAMCQQSRKTKKVCSLNSFWKSKTEVDYPNAYAGFSVFFSNYNPSNQVNWREQYENIKVCEWLSRRSTWNTWNQHIVYCYNDVRDLDKLDLERVDFIPNLFSILKNVKSVSLRDSRRLRQFPKVLLDLPKLRYLNIGLEASINDLPKEIGKIHNFFGPLKLDDVYKEYRELYLYENPDANNTSDLRGALRICGYFIDQNRLNTDSMREYYNRSSELWECDAHLDAGLCTPNANYGVLPPDNFKNCINPAEWEFHYLFWHKRHPRVELPSPVEFDVNSPEQMETLVTSFYSPKYLEQIATDLPQIVEKIQRVGPFRNFKDFERSIGYGEPATILGWSRDDLYEAITNSNLPISLEQISNLNPEQPHISYDVISGRKNSYKLLYLLMLYYSQPEAREAILSYLRQRKQRQMQERQKRLHHPKKTDAMTISARNIQQRGFGKRKLPHKRL